MKLKNWIKKYKKILKDKLAIHDIKKELKNPNSLVYTFQKTKSIFVHVPKTAGLSLIYAVYGDKVELYGHKRIIQYQKVFSHFDQFYKFTVVRNPWDRLYSAYRFLQNNGLNEHDINAREQHLKHISSFEEFVLTWLNENTMWDIIHFFPQHHFLCSEEGELLINQFIKFEDIAAGNIELSSYFNRKIDLPHINKTTESKEYINHYSEAMKEKVQEIYRKDIELFNYKFS